MRLAFALTLVLAALALVPGCSHTPPPPENPACRDAPSYCAYVCAGCQKATADLVRACGCRAAK